MNKIKNVELVIKQGDTLEDIINKVCADAKVCCDEPFIFSAIMMLKEDNTRLLKINHIKEQTDCNIYTVRNVITDLLSRAETGDIVYTQPPLEQWLILYKPLLISIATKVASAYRKERDDMLQILYMTVTNLYSKGYYLHNNLIYKAFINEVNMEYRNDNRLVVVSLDADIDCDEEKDLTLCDMIPDNSYEEQREYEEKLNRILAIKDLMLQDMSELQFDRILIQLKSRTVDRRTSYLLDKYRQMLNSNFVPRPNGRSKHDSTI